VDAVKAYCTTIQKVYEREEARRDGVERQAMTLLGVTGLVASLWSGLGSVLLQYSQKNYFIFTLVLSGLFLLILGAFVAALVFALIALRRIPIHILAPNEVELLDRESEETYLLRTVHLLADATTKNYEQTDYKVRNLKRAQRAFVVGVAGMLFAGIVTVWLSLSQVWTPELGQAPRPILPAPPPIVRR